MRNKPEKGLRRQQWHRRWLIYPLEAILVGLLFLLFRLMPLPVASDLGGWLGRHIGPRLSGNRRALSHLALAMPELSLERHSEIACGMWDNIGRVFGEYPHLNQLAKVTEIVGEEYSDYLKRDDQPTILVSAHLANFELSGIVPAHRGVDVATIYRPPNNPYIDRLLQWLRHRPGRLLVPKGADGARQIIKVLTRKGVVGLLIDQKMNDGVSVPFFGIAAMTAPAAAQLALKYQCLILPGRMERLAGHRCRLTLEPPVDFTPTGDRKADTLALMTLLNQKLENWIRERPEQWLWLHRRWPKDALPVVLPASVETSNKSNELN